MYNILIIGKPNKEIRKVLKAENIISSTLNNSSNLIPSLKTWLKEIPTENKKIISINDSFSGNLEIFSRLKTKYEDNIIFINTSEKKQKGFINNFTFDITNSNPFFKELIFQDEEKEDFFGFELEDIIDDSSFEEISEETLENLEDINTDLEEEEQKPPVPSPQTSFSIMEEMKKEREEAQAQQKTKNIEIEERPSYILDDSQETEGVAILITSRKGGVGKTTMAANLAVTLGSYLTDKKVVLLDGSAGQSDQRIYYENWSDEKKGIANVVRSGGSSSPEIIAKNLTSFGSLRSENIWVLHGIDSENEYGKSDIDESVIIPEFREILTTLKTMVDYIIIDSPVAEPKRAEFINAFVPKADYVATIINQNKATLTHVKKWLFKITSETRNDSIPSERTGYIINSLNSDSLISDTDIKRSMPPNIKFLGSVPLSPIWSRNQEVGEFLIGTPLEPYLRKILFNILNHEKLDASNDEIEKENFFNKMFSKLKKTKKDDYRIEEFSDQELIDDVEETN